MGLYQECRGEVASHRRKERIPMSVHIKYETPKEVAEAVYELVLAAGKDGVIKCGSNEVTKAAERGNAKIVILAEDVNPPELPDCFCRYCPLVPPLLFFKLSSSH